MSYEAVRAALVRGFSARLTQTPDYRLANLWPEQAELLGARAVPAALAPHIWAELARDYLATADLVQALGVSRQALAKRVAAGTLLGVPGRGTTLYPRWQFDAVGGHVRVKTAVSQAFAAWVEESGSLDPFAVLGWANTRQPELQGLTPLEYLDKEEANIGEAADLAFSARVTSARLSQ